MSRSCLVCQMRNKRWLGCGEKGKLEVGKGRAYEIGNVIAEFFHICFTSTCYTVEHLSQLFLGLKGKVKNDIPAVQLE